MQFKIKSVSLIAALFMVLGTATYFANEISAQGKTFEIGQNYGGGIIAYINKTGRHGLIAAEEDQSDHQVSWEDAKALCTKYRGGGYTDWRLPTKNELNLLYKNLYEKEVGGFIGGYYWSSSVYNADNMWYQNFGALAFYNGSQLIYNGNQFFGSKSDLDALVRAVRTF